MSGSRIEVIITDDGSELGRYIFEPGEYLIGREAPADIVVPVGPVSRRHARLILEPDEWLIEDLGSSNGTFLGAQRIERKTRIFPAQEVRIGDAVLQLRQLTDGNSSPEGSVTSDAAKTRSRLPFEPADGRKYEVGETVAAGGMGMILRAEDVAIRRKVAMKVMLERGSRDELLRFAEEAQVTGQLEHPNIVPIHELGVDEQGQPFYTMKFVKGVTLKEVLAKIKAGDARTIEEFPLRRLLTTLLRVCDAIAFANSKGVIHRDLKPENIMIGDFGEVLVMDWGLAKIIGRSEQTSNESSEQRSVVLSVKSEDASAVTLAGTVMGTPHFMAPEQANGEVEKIDARTDVYALGAILYNILTLQPPVAGANVREVLARVRTNEIVAPTSFNAASAKNAGGKIPLPHCPGQRIPNALSAIAMKALSLAQADRYQSANELKAELDAYLAGFATKAEKAGLLTLLALLIKRHKAVTASIAASLVLLIALSVFYTARVVRERNRAELALANLLKTAPTLISQARGLIDEQKFDDALAKISFAIEIDPQNAGYRLLRAQVLEVTLRLSEAAEEFRRVLALGPDESARENLALCEKLLRDNQGKPELDLLSLQALHDLIVKEERGNQAVPLAMRLGGKDARDALFKVRLAIWRKLPGWDKKPESDRVRSNPDGTLNLNFSRLPIEELSVLHGLPVSRLDIGETRVRDLTPIAGIPCERLFASRTPTLVSISAIRTMRLKEVWLGGCDGVQDWSPLGDCPDLEKIVIPPNVGEKALEPLRRLTKLRIVAVDGYDLNHGFSPEEFREKVTPGDPANLARVALIQKVREALKAAGAATVGLESGKMNGGTVKVLPDGTLDIRYNQSDLKTLAPLPKDLPVSVLDIGGTGVSDLSPIAEMPLRELIAWGTPVSDVSPLAKCRNLQSVRIFNTKVRDLSPLAGLRLQRLEVGGNPAVSDISVVAGMPLRMLTLDKTSVADFRPLLSCPDLEILTIPSTAKDIGQLRALKKLVRLSTKWDLSAGEPSKSAKQFWVEWDARNALEKMGASPNGVAVAEDGTLKIEFNIVKPDLSALKGLPISQLKLSIKQVTDLTPLQGMPLRVLFLDETSVSDLGPLRGIALECLTFSGTKVKDLTPLRGMPLKKISFDRTPVLDVSPLADCKELEQIVLPKPARNLEALRALPKLRALSWGWPGSWENLTPAATFWAEYDAKKAAEKK